MNSDRVAVYVAAEISLPEVLRIAAGLGAHITSTDISRTATDRVVTIDADVAVLLADIDDRLRFVPDITAPEPEPEPEPVIEPVTEPKPVAKKTAPAKDTAPPVKTAAKPTTSGDEQPKPKKKTKAKKTTARRKTRGANGGES